MTITEDRAIRPLIDHRDELLGYLNRLDHRGDVYRETFEAADWAQRQIDCHLGVSVHRMVHSEGQR